MLRHIVGREADGALPLPPVPHLAQAQRSIVCDVLHDPLLPVRDANAGVVLAGLDKVTRADGEAVAAVHGRRVVDLTARDSFVTDTRVHGTGLVVRTDGDRFAVVPVAGDLLPGLVTARMEAHQPQGCELVEHLAGVLPVAHPQREVGVGGVGEAVHLGHVERAAPELRGHIEYPAAPDCGELRAISDQRDRRPGFGAHREQGDCGVLVEHSGLVHDHPLAAGEPSVLGGSAIGASGLGVGVAGGEARPYAVIVPAPSVRVHERRHARGGYAEFFMRDLRGAQRRCHHPRRSAVMRRDFNCDTQHRGLACACCALHDHERIGRCDGGSSLLLPRIDTARLRRLAHVGVPRLALRHSCGDQVAQLGLGLHDAHRGEMRHMLGCRSARGEHGETIFQRQPRRNGDEVAQLLTGCAHPGLGDDLRGVLLHGVPRVDAELPAAQRSSARDAICCTDSSSSATGSRGVARRRVAGS